MSEAVGKTHAVRRQVGYGARVETTIRRSAAPDNDVGPVQDEGRELTPVRRGPAVLPRGFPPQEITRRSDAFPGRQNHVR